mmetsp:Transcript_81579/g.132225  ORF Transcript_81579/g.132225 Transcript_81579/m.132225 type:complete len:361 (-) Transcript_81579:183-1265(-)
MRAQRASTKQVRVATSVRTAGQTRTWILWVAPMHQTASTAGQASTLTQEVWHLQTVASTSAETASTWQETRPAMTATRRMAMAAAAPVESRRDGTARPPRYSELPAARKCVGTRPKHQARAAMTVTLLLGMDAPSSARWRLVTIAVVVVQPPVTRAQQPVETGNRQAPRLATTATLPQVTGARTSALWSAGSCVVDQHHNSATPYAEMGSLLVTRSAMITTPSAGMAATAPVPRSLDGTAPPPRNVDKLAVLQSVETARKLGPSVVTTATLCLEMGVRTRAPWTVGTTAAILTVQIKPPCVRSHVATAWLQPRKRAMMATLKQGMDATAAPLKSGTCARTKPVVHPLVMCLLAKNSAVMD